MSRLQLVNSRSIYSYRKLLAELTPVFGSGFCQSLLEWCRILPETDDLFWELYQIHCRGQCIGITGLYSLVPDSPELWLGWFGLLPECRGKGLGATALSMIKERARNLGSQELLAYVDRRGEPLPFYFRNGFTRWGSVAEFRSQAPCLPEWAFEQDEDHVIHCIL